MWSVRFRRDCKQDVAFRTDSLVTHAARIFAGQQRSVAWRKPAQSASLAPGANCPNIVACKKSIICSTSRNIDVKPIPDGGGDAESPARLQHAIRLTECLWTIVDPVEHTIHVGHIEGRLPKRRQILRLADSELEASVTAL